MGEQPGCMDEQQTQFATSQAMLATSPHPLESEAGYYSQSVMESDARIAATTAYLLLINKLEKQVPVE